MSEVVIDNPETKGRILVTVEQLRGYEAMQKEEVSQTIALLQITMQQMESCKDASEIESMFDAVLNAAPGKNLEDYVERRICRAITLVGLMTHTEIPSKFVMIDEIVYKAAGILLTEQQKLQSGDIDTQVAATESVQ